MNEPSSQPVTYARPGPSEPSSQPVTMPGRARAALLAARWEVAGQFRFTIGHLSTYKQPHLDEGVMQAAWQWSSVDGGGWEAGPVHVQAWGKGEKVRVSQGTVEPPRHASLLCHTGQRLASTAVAAALRQAQESAVRHMLARGSLRHAPSRARWQPAS